MSVRNRISLVWAVGCLIAIVAFGQSAEVPPASDYAYGWPVIIDKPADFYEIRLPLEVYQTATDARLRDMGVYNGRGLPVPRMMMQEQTERQATEERIALPILPLYQGREHPTQDIRMFFERDGERTTITLNDAGRPGLDAAATPVSAYIVDVADLEADIDALALHWTPDLETFIGHIDVHGSNDLESWRLIGSGSIAALEHEGASIQRRVVDINGDNFTFLRITWRAVPSAWSLTEVFGVSRGEVADTPRQWLELASLGEDEDDGGLIFDVDGSPIVDRVALRLPNDNTVLRASIYIWRSESSRWQRVSGGQFYHLRSNADSVESEPMIIEAQRARRWKVAIDRGRSNGAFKLAVGWRPDKLIFVAQGDGPYQLVAGRAADRTDGFPQQAKFSDTAIYELAQDSRNTTNAELGQRYELAGPDQLRVRPKSEWGQWVLWVSLSFAVMLVGWMALSLMRQLKSN